MKHRVLTDSVGVIATSPPYDDSRIREDYLNWMVDVSNEMYRVLSPEGSLFLNLGSKPRDPWVCYDVISIFRRSFILQNTFHWIKSVHTDKTHGHFKPINSPRYVNDCHEFIFHLTKTGSVPLDRKAVGVPCKDKSNIKRFNAGGDLRCRGNTWYIPYDTIQSRTDERGGRPATFPPKLPEMCYLIHGLSRIELALDPFCGMGNSAIAAEKLKINFVGFETSKHYYDKSLKLLGEVKIA